jgi:hypothetical protein
VTRFGLPFSGSIHSCTIQGVHEFLTQLYNNPDVRVPVLVNKSSSLNGLTGKTKNLNTSCTNAGTEEKETKTPWHSTSNL